MSQAHLKNSPRGEAQVSESSILLSTSAAEPPMQLLDSVSFDGMFTNESMAADTFANYIAFLSSNQTGLQDERSHELQNWSMMTDPAQQQYCASLIPGIDEQSEVIQFPNIRTKSAEPRDTIGGPLDSTSPATATSDMGDITGNERPTAESPQVRKQRRQNHSCDQCRSSKKACDLPLTVRISHKSPSTSCSTCDNRGMRCTVTWLAGRKSKREAKKRANMVSNVAEAGDINAEEQPAYRLRPPIPEGISAVETNLSRQLDSRKLGLQYFNLYVDVCDVPISECLLQGSMPPQYNMGIAALAPLSGSRNLAIHLKIAKEWINSCWETVSDEDLWSSSGASPHAFRTVALLDAIFHCKIYNEVPHAVASLRDASINDTYKWVAIATASQFTIEGNHSSSYSRDLATAAWRKAREMIFENMAATDSFRHSLSMALFGLIIWPKISPEEDYFSERDSVYVLCEGIRRLDSLCAEATRHLEDVEDNSLYSAGERSCKLAPDEKEKIVELIGAIQWLANFTNDAVIATSHGAICPMPIKAIIDINPKGTRRTMRSLQAPDLATSVNAQKDQDIENSIFSRAMTQRQTLMALECSSRSFHTVKDAVRNSALLLILLWRAVASFMLVAKSVRTGKADYKIIASRYEATMNLVVLWRSSFGIFDGKSIESLQQSSSEIRRIFAFCVNDGDLGVLLFHETMQNLEKDLAGRPLTSEKTSLCDILDSTRSCLQSQRSMSAVQISTLAAICGRVSSAGIQGNGGAKFNVQDIGARPVSSNPLNYIFTFLEWLTWLTRTR
jgi:hypothetical protein